MRRVPSLVDVSYRTIETVDVGDRREKILSHIFAFTASESVLQIRPLAHAVRSSGTRNECGEFLLPVGEVVQLRVIEMHKAQRHWLVVLLAFDHRVTDDATAAAGVRPVPADLLFHFPH